MQSLDLLCFNISTEFFFKNVRFEWGHLLNALINNGTVSMRLIAIGNAFHNRGPTTLNERSPKLTSFVRGTSNRCCCEEHVRPVEHYIVSLAYRQDTAVPCR